MYVPVPIFIKFTFHVDIFKGIVCFALSNIVTIYSLWHHARNASNEILGFSRASSRTSPFTTNN